MRFLIHHLLTGRRAIFLGISLGSWLTMQAASCGSTPTRAAHVPDASQGQSQPLNPSSAETDKQFEQQLKRLSKNTDNSALNPDNLRALKELLGVSSSHSTQP